MFRIPAFALSPAWLAMFVMLNPPAAIAQARPTNLASPTDNHRADVIARLRSADPREQAWGAWLSGRDVMPETIPLLQRVVHARAASVGLADTAALDIALDALIQLQAKVPPDLALAVYEQR